MEHQAKQRGRPRKDATEGTPKQQKQREYMRNYVAGINSGIKQLEKDELECLKELEKIRKERMALVEQLDKANKQAMGILKEKVGK